MSLSLTTMTLSNHISVIFRRTNLWLYSRTDLINLGLNSVPGLNGYFVSENVF